MLVYGDRSRRADPRAELATLRAEVVAAERLPGGLARHAALVAALIAAGELAQGLADAAFERAQEDVPDLAADLALEATRRLAEAVWASWRRDFAAGPVDGDPLAALARAPMPPAVILKQGEGYAFYALYPETYAEAAAAAPRPTAVVGLRSIGTSLAAMAAAGSGAETLLTLRPSGAPFAREIRASAELEGLLSPAPESVWAVVDEGPGLSGSSFAAAAGWLEAQGVPPGAIQLYPSHSGEPGGEANEAIRARWRGSVRRHVAFEEAIAPRLAAWVEDLTGAASEPLQDLSGGAWRALRCGPDEADWPASNTYQERRKFLLRSREGAFLLKFAGLGEVGGRKLARARKLFEAGFVPEPLGLRHGFLVERWVEPGAPAPPRPVRLERLADYLAFRARSFPADRQLGAALDDLSAMLRRNAREALGREVDDVLTAWRPALDRIGGQVQPVAVDGRLHRQEWVTAGDGRWLKTDAVDHSEAHDLVGCQDIAWDLAGATVEFDLDADEADTLARAVAEGCGRERDPALVAFMTAGYCAFQLGAHAMAAEAHAGQPREAARLAAARDRYAARLRRSLA